MKSLQVFLLAVAMTLAGSNAQARDLVIVLDASNSMWGQIEGQAKITIAREALSGLIDALDAGDRVGLIAYGHRREGDCQDVELIRPLSPLDAAALKQQINAVNPKGKTPITNAMEAAFGAIGESGSSIILVSDGIETCDADPCAAVKAAKDRGLDFNLEVIGFDVDAEARAQLACMAEAGGGRLLTAADAAELVLAVEQAGGVQASAGAVSMLSGQAAIERGGETLQQVQPDDEVFREDELRTAADSRLSVALTDGSQIELDEDSLLAIQNYILDPAADSEMFLRRGRLHSTVSSRFSSRRQSFRVLTPNAVAGVQGTIFSILFRNNTTEVFVEEGQVAVNNSDPGVTGQVILNPGEFTRVEADQPPEPVSTPELTINVNLNGAAASAQVSVTDRGQVKASGTAPLVQALHPGNYKVTATLDDGFSQTDDVTLPADGLEHTVEITIVDSSVSAPQSAVEGSVIEVSWTGPDNQNDYITVVPAGADDATYTNYTRTNKGTPLTLRMPEESGDYEIRYVENKDKKVLASQAIIIEPAGATLQGPESAIEGSEISVTWEGPDNPSDYITVVPVGSESGAYTNYTRSNKGSPLTLRMPEEAGDFELWYVLNQSKKTIAIRPITILPAEATLQGPESAGEGAEISVTWTGPDNRSDYITVVAVGSASGAYTNYTRTDKGSPLTLRMPEESGDFEIWYVLNQSKKTIATRPITILPAEATLQAPESAGEGAEISVTWTGPDNRSDYITVVPVGSAPGAYTNYTRTDKGSPLNLRMPEESGDFEIWYVLNQSKKTIATTPITIIPVEATLEATDEVPAGQEYMVDWTGPDNRGDYITIVETGSAQGAYTNYVRTASGSPAKLRSPDQPGDYEIWYVLDQSKKTIASRPVTITPVSIELTVEGSLMVEAEIEVGYSAGGSPDDYITIVPMGAPEKQYAKYKYTRSGNPVKLKLPDTPGDYEIRYLTKQTGTTLARQAIVVMPLGASVSATGPVAASSRFPVNWAGPNNQGDFIAVAAEGSPPGQYIARALSAAGNPVNLFAPREPGTYELRYVGNKGTEVLATGTLEVE